MNDMELEKKNENTESVYDTHSKKWINISQEKFGRQLWSTFAAIWTFHILLNTNPAEWIKNENRWYDFIIHQEILIVLQKAKAFYRISQFQTF